MPFFSITYPMAHLIRSAALTMVNIQNTLKSVNLLMQNAVGTLTTHTKTLSKRNVIKVLPPERMVKYDELINENTGKNRACRSINLVAISRAASVVS